MVVRASDFSKRVLTGVPFMRGKVPASIRSVALNRVVKAIWRDAEPAVVAVRRDAYHSVVKKAVHLLCALPVSTLFRPQKQIWCLTSGGERQAVRFQPEKVLVCYQLALTATMGSGKGMHRNGAVRRGVRARVVCDNRRCG